MDKSELHELGCEAMLAAIEEKDAGSVKQIWQFLETDITSDKFISTGFKLLSKDDSEEAYEMMYELLRYTLKITLDMYLRDRTGMIGPHKDSHFYLGTQYPLIAAVRYRTDKYSTKELLEGIRESDIGTPVGLLRHMRGDSDGAVWTKFGQAVRSSGKEGLKAFNEMVNTVGEKVARSLVDEIKGPIDDVTLEAAHKIAANADNIMYAKIVENCWSANRRLASNVDNRLELIIQAASAALLI